VNPWRRRYVANFLSGDDHALMLARYTRREPGGRRLIFTIHQPLRHWRQECLDLLRKLDGIITMCESEAASFREAVPNVPVKCIPHGVDTNHWKPVPRSGSAVKKVGYCGKYLRNVAMFIRVAARVLANRSDVEFCCLITPGGMSDDWKAFGANPRVRVFSDLSANEVVQFYQQLDVLMMPLDDTTANNAIVEAMSCGVPVLSNNVGGIATYGGGAVFPLVDNNDDDGLYEQLLRYLDDPILRNRTGLSCRSFAERELAWEQIARRHAEFYQALF
jgi:glycosyltransferase involved in cell wall biosynthesis